MTANATVDWLKNHGGRYGWVSASASVAQSYANQGRPAIVVWKNPTGASGHIAIVRPDSSSFDVRRGPAIAQAGESNHEATYTSATFGAGFSNNTLQYWVHA